MTPKNLSIRVCCVDTQKFTKLMKKQLIMGLTLVVIATGAVMTAIQPAAAGYRWVTGRNGYVPPKAVVGGFDGENLYVCSIGVGIGKLVPKQKKCYVPHNGNESGYDKYQVLVVDNFHWAPLTSDLDLPPGAITGGTDGVKGGEPVYVCNAVVAGKWIPGKYTASHNVCYVPYKGKEIEVKSFNVLISR
jgi:hypothetical protein